MAQAATYPDTSRGEQASAWPQLLPDGQHFLFLRWIEGKPESTALRLGRIGSKESKTLAMGKYSRVEYVPPGYILYLRGRTLLAQPFDAKRLRLAGDAFPVVDDVVRGDPFGRADFSASAIGTLVYSWPQALAKAKAADRIVRERLLHLGLAFDEIYTEYFGVNACLGAAAPSNPDPPEVQVRIGVRGADKKAADRFTRELIPLVLNGPPSATGFGEGRPPVREIVAYWSALVPREEIVTRVEVVE